MNKERIIYLDVLRIISIFSVIIIHVAAMDWYTSPIDSLAWQSVNVYHAVTRFCVPVMFMISGALFLSADREIKLNRLWSKNICRIVMAFVFWSALYAAPYWANMIIRHMDIIKSSGVNVISEFYKEILNGHFHLWFLYALLPLYILTPFIRKFINDKKLLQYFLLLSFIFAVLIPTAQAVPFINTLISPAAAKLNLDVALFSRYSFYFILGYYLSSDALSQAAVQRYIKLIYISGIISTIITIYGTVLISFAEAKASGILLDYLTPFTACQSAAVFIFIKRMFTGGGGINLSLRAGKIIENISELCFGVYLVHDVFNILIRFFKINLYLIEKIPLCSVLILSFTVFLCSLLTSWLLHKVPVLKRYIM